MAQTKKTNEKPKAETYSQSLLRRLADPLTISASCFLKIASADFPQDVSKCQHLQAN